MLEAIYFGCVPSAQFAWVPDRHARCALVRDDKK